MVSKNYTAIHNNMDVTKVIEYKISTFLLNNLKIREHILEFLICKTLFTQIFDGIFLDRLPFDQSVKKRLLFDVCDSFKVVEPFFGVEVDYLVKGIILSLVQKGLRIQNTDLLTKLSYILLDELSIDLKWKHQISKNTFSQSKSLSTLECLFQL